MTAVQLLKKRSCRHHIGGHAYVVSNIVLDAALMRLVECIACNATKHLLTTEKFW